MPDWHSLFLEERDRRYTELGAERDRRYAEVARERARSLQIKQEEDRRALELARQIQDYKDDKANELRDQIAAERGFYATKSDVTAAVREVMAKMDPVLSYSMSQQGRQSGFNAGWLYLLGAMSAAASVTSVLAFLMR